MSYLWILPAVALAASACGWLKTVYFFSLGYGYGIAALAVTIAVLFPAALTGPTAVALLLLVFFGMRLSTYLLVREKKSKTYKKFFDEATSKKNPFGVDLAIWVACALLYVGEVSPLAFRLGNASRGAAVSGVWVWIGVVFMVLGILLESVADAQKAAAKKVNPHRFVDTGLYRLVRCPNYLGEITLWTGVLVMMIGIHACFWQWLIAALGYLGIIYVMFSGAHRLEVRQNTVYGDNPEYQAYVKKTPIMLPFVPLYSVARYTWLRG